LIFAKNKENESEGGRGSSQWHGKVADNGEECRNVGASEWHGKVADNGEECRNVGWSIWGPRWGMHYGIKRENPTINS
jgi:hypothetical protein